MKIAILGFGKEGQAALEYWQKDDNQVTVCDQHDVTVPAGVAKQTGANYLSNLAGFDVIVRSPGLHPNDIVKANSPDILNKVTSVTNEFFKVCPSQNIIGVTGTKGKGTTSTLISQLLEAAGKTVHLGGNIGRPTLDILKAGVKPDDWVVLELSSFQLIDIKTAPHISVCLMVVPEHLNWHADLDEYVRAKQQMFAHQTAQDVAVFNRNNGHSQEVALVSPAATKISYEVPGPGAEPQQTTGAYLKGDTIYMNETPVCQVNEVALLGRHNLENVCAAVAATWELIDQNAAVVKKVVSQFKGLEHRLELVRDINGIRYYDDSFGTTPETAIVAIQAFDHPKVVILGGANKNTPFDALAQVVAANNVRSVILIGDTAPQIEDALKLAGYNHIIPGGTNMTDIVQVAHSQAQPGDVVLLSTACASFGLFTDYKDRGEQFQAAVRALR